jgi:catechol 2,3-dioxygenase-like lactoylglutathione lyase family enzyme
MCLLRLTHLTVGVPNVEETAQYYTDFGLIPADSAPGGTQRRFATVDGGEQLTIVHRPVRQLVDVGIGTEDHDDLGRIASALGRLEVAADISGDTLATREPATQIGVKVTVVPKLEQKFDPEPYNYPGEIQRPNVRAGALHRGEPVRPRRLGHVVFGSPDFDGSKRFFTEGLGFRLSDEVKNIGAFMRCSPDHHNVLVQAAPVPFLHHTSWEVEDIDEIGRGAQNMLAGHPERHVWGLGRHWIGSNYFYYLRDPAGNFSEYYSDMDEILDDQLWDAGIWGLEKDPNAWGPSMPPSMITPDDLAELMAALH